jgi:CheY-like chemotaxis protein
LSAPEVSILLVEDDDVDALAVTRGLTAAKISNPVVRVRDGLEALEILLGTEGKEKLRPPYVLLVDIRLPRLDGLSLVRKIRANKELQRSVIFILTTSDSDRDLTAAYDAHVAGYIIKSSIGDQFSRVAKMIEYYLSIISLPLSSACA